MIPRFWWRCDRARKFYLNTLAIVQKILYIKRVGIQKREKLIMSLFKTPPTIVATRSNQLSAEEEYLASFGDDADNWFDRVQALAAELSHSAPNARYGTLQSVAGEIVDGNITHKEGVARLTSKKVVIKKK